MKKQQNNLDKAINALKNEPTPPGPPQEAIKSTLAKLARAAEKPHTTPVKKRIKITERTKTMKNLTKIAVAAAIIIAVIIGINHFSGSIDGASVAWADVAGNVEHLQSVAYRMTAEVTGLPTGQAPQSESLVYVSSEYGMRMDTYMADKLVSITYMVPKDNVVITVLPDEKKFLRRVLPPDKAKQMHEKEDPRQFIKQLMSVEHEELGPSQIDGIDVEGIEVSSPRVTGGMFEDATARLWVATGTDLPVRVEIEGKAMGGQTQMKMVLDDFQWDAQLDPSFFEPNIPSDYTSREQTLPEVTEATTIRGLRAFAEIADGRYPSSLAMITVMQEAGEAAKAKPDVKLSQQEKAVPTFEDIIPASGFYAKLTREDKDVAYYGNTVTADDADAVLMRWKISDNQYRVIFGDLTAENVTAEQLAELEGTSVE